MNELTILARSTARRLGVIHLIRHARHFFNRASADYEASFCKEFINSILPGDVVWDVGANVGYYTEMLAERLINEGKVIAFEPAPQSFAKLSEKLSQRKNVVLEASALGDSAGRMKFLLEQDGTSPTQRIVDPSVIIASGIKSGRLIEVPVTTGKSYVAVSGHVPNVIKIDVEGFEEEVLKGLDDLLASPCLRTLFIEVHFKLLEERGRAMAPIRIERSLRSTGFRTRWIDASHLRADRVIVPTMGPP